MEFHWHSYRVERRKWTGETTGSCRLCKQVDMTSKDPRQMVFALEEGESSAAQGL